MYFILYMVFLWRVHQKFPIPLTLISMYKHTASILYFTKTCFFETIMDRGNLIAITIVADDFQIDSWVNMLDYTLPLSGRGTERWSPQKSYFNILHIELQHTNSLRACHRDYWIWLKPTLQYSLYHWPTIGMNR